MLLKQNKELSISHYFMYISKTQQIFIINEKNDVKTRTTHSHPPSPYASCNLQGTNPPNH